MYLISDLTPKTLSMGIVRSFYKDLSSKEEKAINKRDNLIIDDVVVPESFEIPRSDVTPKSFDDADKFIKKAFKKAQKEAPKTFGVKSYFRINVADGWAYYIVTEINKTSCEIEWRGFGGGDRYTDHYLGWGGKYPTSRIRSYVERDQAIDKLFRSKSSIK